MKFPTEEIISFHDLFWQYPGITEEKFYNQNKHDPCYFGFPWATVIDKRINLSILYNSLNTILKNNNTYYTCCLHISFRKLIPLWKKLNITEAYVSHKIKGEDIIDNVVLKPCPLFAINIEDNRFNMNLKNIDFLNCKRDILYSFVGGYNAPYYLSEIRPNIFKGSHPENTIIQHSGTWHLDNIVYNYDQNYLKKINLSKTHMQKTINYNTLLLTSRYTLSPSGSGPNSIRFWEALGVGSIPILLADTLELPKHELWE